MGKKRLKDEHQRFVVQCLARFETPQAVADLVKEKFNIAVTRQAVECYDPTKVAGLDLGADLRELFFTEREAYGARVASVGVAHKTVRLQAIERMLKKAEEQGNFRWFSHLLNQSREEVEGVRPGKPDSAGSGKGAAKGVPTLKVTFENGSGDSPPAQAAPEADGGV